MDDKHFPTSEALSNFTYQRPEQSNNHNAYSSPENYNYAATLGSSPNTNPLRFAEQPSQRCFPRSSETSPVKSFVDNVAQQSYPNVTTAWKFDPFGYNSPRSPSQHNFHQPVPTPQQRLVQTQQKQLFFDEIQQVNRQRPSTDCPSTGISPTTAPSAATAQGFFHLHSRPSAVQQHRQQTPFFSHPSTTAVGSFQQHFQAPGIRGSPLSAHLPPQPFFPTGPPTSTMNSTPVLNNFGTDGGQLLPPFMFDGKVPPDGTAAGNLSMNVSVGTIDFNEDFPGGISGVRPAQYNLSDELMAKIHNSAKQKALFELQIGLEQIAYDVSNIFDTWATVIKERLVGNDDPLSSSDLDTSAAILIEMAVVLNGTQYNYSRLGQYLCRTIDTFATCTLLPQISVFINETNTLLSAQHLRNLVLFLAELYDKLEVKGVKSSELAAYLFDQLRNLLKLDPPVDDQTVDVTVKTLKLVGRFLENDRGPQAMSEFLIKFEQFVQDATVAQLSESAREKVRCLLNLRENKWGVVAEPNTGDGPVTAASTSLGIIGPDGVPLTEDECAFMEDNLDTFVDNSPGELQSLNAFDEDNVEDDYEKFLQATAIRAAEKALEKVSIDEDDDVSSIVSSVGQSKLSTSK